MFSNVSGKGDKNSQARGAYPLQPNAPYPLPQGPTTAPIGAPPAVSVLSPPGHTYFPQHIYQPYPTGGAVPQAPPAYPFQTPAMIGPPPPYSQGAVPGPMTYIMPPPQPVVVPGLYDASARFGGVAGPSIPPPPPGIAPNAAQIAAMQGHTVIGTQKKSNQWTDGSGGGSTFW